jgi:heme-degrading monooxygenase HmoA
VKRVTTHTPGTIAVIFVSQRSAADAEGYAAAAGAMAELASRQPGYRGVDSVRDEAGLGITVSYWASEAAALAWRDDPEHTAIREAGRGRWYTHYDLHVAAVTRSYDWSQEP